MLIGRAGGCRSLDGYFRRRAGGRNFLPIFDRWMAGGWRAGTRVVGRVVGRMGGFGLYYWPGGPVAWLFFFFDFMAANQDQEFKTLLFWPQIHKQG